jgi:hypothetical protein
MNVVTVVKRGLTPPEGFQQAEGAFSASPPRGARQATPRGARQTPAKTAPGVVTAPATFFENFLGTLTADSQLERLMASPP